MYMYQNNENTSMTREPIDIRKLVYEGKAIYEPTYGVVLNPETGEVLSDYFLPAEYEPTKNERFGSRFKERKEFIHSSYIPSVSAWKFIADILRAYGYIRRCRQKIPVNIIEASKATGLYPSAIYIVLSKVGCKPGVTLLPEWTKKMSHKNFRMAADLYFFVRRMFGIDLCKTDKSTREILDLLHETFEEYYPTKKKIFKRKTLNNILLDSIKLYCSKQQLQNMKTIKRRNINCKEFLEYYEQHGTQETMKKYGFKTRNALYTKVHNCRKNM